MSRINILILTQGECAFCDAAKAIFDRLSGEFPLSVTSVPLDSPDVAALAQRGGILFPPGIFIDGEPFSYGRPSEGKIRRELERRTNEGDGKIHRQAEALRFEVSPLYGRGLLTFQLMEPPYPIRAQ
jgi:hypothetical protein